MRLVRRYRAAERYRQKRQTTPQKRHPEVPPPSPQRMEFSVIPAEVFEKVARVWNANTLAWRASAAMVPTTPGFVAGRLLAENGRFNAETLSSHPNARNFSPRQ